MKRFKILFFIVVAFAAAFSVFAQDLKVLTIGNSFSRSLKTHFKKAAESVDGCRLEIGYACFGGCELDRHWRYIQQEEKEGKKIYGGGKSTLKEILQSKKWDIVTIQQASHKSWIADSYFPYAQNILDYISKNCPGAKVYIQQTWSYRSDSPMLSSWNITQEQMYRRLSQAYDLAAKRLGIRQIPTGLAVELARKAIPDRFLLSRKDIDLSKYRYPDMPSQSGDVVGKFFWKKDKKAQMRLYADTIHLNSYGEYLQACVWFAALYNRSATEIKYVPENMSEAQAISFREIADRAVKEYKGK